MNKKHNGLDLDTYRQSATSYQRHGRTTAVDDHSDLQS